MLFFIVVFKVKTIYLKFVGSSDKSVYNTHRLMIIFIVFYLTVTILFHLLVIIIPETYPMKNLSVYIFGTVVFILDFSMFYNFVKDFFRIIKMLDSNNRFVREDYNICFKLNPYKILI